MVTSLFWFSFWSNTYSIWARQISKQNRANNIVDETDMDIYYYTMMKTKKVFEQKFGEIIKN